MSVPEPLREKCAMCDKGWSRQPDSPRHPCPQCGEAAWDVEPDLGRAVGESMEYRVAEVETDPHLIMSLGLVWPLNSGNRPRVRLPHRLKETYRHAVKDHGWKDGRGLIIRFTRSNGAWGLSLRPPTESEERRVRTDTCQRHQWALGIHRPPFDINRFADQIHCSCPADPSCEVCMIAAQFAEDRRRPGSHGDRFYSHLQNAVMRDLGLMA